MLGESPGGVCALEHTIAVRARNDARAIDAKRRLEAFQTGNKRVTNSHIGTAVR